MGFSSSDETSPIVQTTIVLAANGVDLVTIFGPFLGPALCDRVLSGQTEGIAHEVWLWYSDGTNTVIAGSATLAASQGINGGPSVDLLAAALPTGAVPIYLPTGASLQIRMSPAMGGSEECDFTAMGGYVS